MRVKYADQMRCIWYASEIDIAPSLTHILCKIFRELRGVRDVSLSTEHSNGAFDLSQLGHGKPFSIVE